MHEVYSAHHVLLADAQLKIESLDCWENNIYIGTADGHLLHYCVELGENAYKSELITRRQLASKKAVFMLKVLLPVQRIVAGIDGSDIIVLSLTSLQDVEVMPNTKGCKALCTNSESSHNSVCVVVKRKLMLFDHVGSFVLAKEFILPDTPDVVHWRGKFIATAYKRSYCVMSSLDGSVDDLNVEFDPRVTRPFISFLKSDELMVVKESLGVVLDCSGMPTRSSLNLSDAAPQGHPVSVLAATLLEPFVIVLQGNGVCVFGLDSDITLQVIDIKYALGMCESGDRIYVFGKEGVSMLLPVPPAMQVKQLLSQGDVHAALRVHAVMPGSDDSSVHSEAASVFFKQLQFSNAVKHWITAGTDPRAVLLTFPDVVNRLPPACFFGVKNGTGGSIVDIVRSGVSTLQQQQPVRNSRGSRPAAVNDTASVELDQLQIDLYVQEAVSAVAKFLLSVRSLSQWKSLLPTLDSALAILLVLAKDERHSLSFFVAQPHHVVVEWIEAFLEQHDQFLQLGQLHAGAHQPARALNAWRQLQVRISSRSSTAPHVTEAIHLLVECNSANLVREHALWIIDVCDEAAVKLVSSLPLSAIEPREMLQLLPANDERGKLRQKLLLAIYVEERQLEDEFLQTQYGCILADAAVSSQKISNSDVRNSSTFAFEQFLRSFSSYNVAVLQNMISGDDSFLIAACLLLRAINRHEAALSLLCRRLSPESVNLCEDYCTGGVTFAMRRDDKSSTDPSKLLLVFVQMMHGDSCRIFTSIYSSIPIQDRRNAAMQVMQRNAHILDFLEFLPALPPSLPLNQVSPLISTSMQQLLHNARTYHILRSLAKVDNVVTKCQLISAREACVRVTRELSCAKCNKRIGDAAFVVPPSQAQLAYHLNCYESPS